MLRKKALVCDVCGEAGAKVRRLARSYGKGADLFVIENVPVITCPHCGESYLTAETLHELDRLKAARGKLAARRSVPVLAFAS